MSRHRADPSCNTFALPEELCRRPQWVCWEAVQRGDDWTKPPVNPHNGGSHASTTDPSTWADLETAAAVAHERKIGLGFVFSPDDDLVGIDLDNCLGPDGTLQPWAQRIVDTLNSYTGISPSRTGVKIIVRSTLPGPGRNHRLGNGSGEAIEMYDRGRYFALPAAACPAPRRPLPTGRRKSRRCTSRRSGRRLPRRLRHRIRRHRPATTTTGCCTTPWRAGNGQKVERLFSGLWRDAFGSQSEADLACVSMLAFWTQNPAQLDRLFRRSALFRPEKWDRPVRGTGPHTGRRRSPARCSAVNDTPAPRPPTPTRRTLSQRTPSPRPCPTWACTA